MKKHLEIIPGFLLALFVAFCARFIESILPIHLIGASVIALFIGMGINQIKKPSKKIQAGLKFTSKKILKFAITRIQNAASSSRFIIVFLLLLFLRVAIVFS